jgi:hypothetical protein
MFWTETKDGIDNTKKSDVLSELVEEVTEKATEYVAHDTDVKKCET